MPNLPLTPNGKLDRSALPAPAAPSESRTAPRTPHEILLCTLFAEALGLTRVYAEDDFFHLGGHSLLAVRLIKRIREELGVEMSLSSIFKSPTPAALAGHISRASPSQSSLELVLPIRLGGGKNPIFCIHPASGVSWAYAGLIPSISAEHPIYGIQARNILQPDALPATIDEMASTYVSAIRQVQSKGPYHLLGFSFGGLVAHTIATQLQEHSESVDLLAILDMYPPDSIGGRSIEVNGEGGREDDELALLANLIEPLGYDRSRLGDDPLQDFLEILRQEGNIAASLSDQHHIGIVATYKATAQLVKTFSPRRFRGDIDLFVARIRSDEAPVERWRPWTTGETRSHPMECTHEQMMDQVQLARIGTIISRILAGSRSP